MASGLRPTTVTAGLLLGLVLAQNVPPEAPVADLERIRKALSEPAPVFTIAASVDKDGPVFRMRIKAFDLGPAWEDRSIVPPYVRPWFRAYHHEFLEQVLQNRERSEVFRGPTLYPIGIEMIQLVQFLAKHINAANQRRHEADVKEEVRLALEKFLACRTNSNRTGC
jgi:hypothetical protein